MPLHDAGANQTHCAPSTPAYWAGRSPGTSRRRRRRPTSGQVSIVDEFDFLQVGLQWLDKTAGQKRHSILIAFTTADDDMVLIKIDVFDAHAHTFD